MVSCRCGHGFAMASPRRGKDRIAFFRRW
jgi:hypothetical protein